MTVLQESSRAYVNAGHYLNLSTATVVRAAMLSAKNVNFSNGQSGPARGPAFMIFFIVVHAVLRVYKQQVRDQRLWFLVRSFVLDRLWNPGGHSRGKCVVELATARLGWSGEDLGSESVIWIDEWSNKFGHTCLGVAHVRDHALLPTSLRRH